MTHDENNSKPERLVAIEPELEARLVAWIAGEASEFEGAELERLVATRPELANFKQRLDLVRDLLKEAAKPDALPLRLSAERRAKLLKTLGADAEVLPLREQIVVLPPPPRWWNGRGRRVYLVMAGVAVGCVAAMIQIARQEPMFMERAEIQFGKRDGAVTQMQQVVDADIRSGGDMQVKAVRLAAEELKRENISEKRRDERQSVAISLPPTESAPEPAPAQILELPAPSPLFAGQAAAADDLKQKTDLSAVGRTAAGGKGLLASAGAITLGTSAPAVTFGRDEGWGAGGSRSLLKPANGPRLLDSGGVSPAAAVAASGSVVTLSEFSVSAEKKEANVVAAVAARVRAAAAADQEKDADKAPVRPASPPPPAEETTAAQEPYSTFSLHVSDVSFRLAHAALRRGTLPDAGLIRPEEFYNAFNYGDPAPTTAEKIGARIEQAAHPFLQERNLVRIAMKVPATGRGAGTPLRLTVLLDTSGSMEREDRVASVRRALEVLVSLLTPADRVTLIGFARQPRLLLENLAGDQARQVLDLIARLPAEGGTNLEAALQLGGELARRHQRAGAQNRIVVLTDGAANLGSADPARLALAIDTLRQQGIAFDACGVGLDGLDDAMLEALTRRGDGRYYVLNSPDAADAGFARQLAGAFRPAAENVKLQVRFNPARVGRYRLIGFEQHRLRTEDFRNDRVDAAELAADEAAVALYQIEVRPEGAGELGDVFVRFRDAATGEMIERSWPIAYDATARAFDRATPTLQLAGTAALLAEKLRGGAAAEPIKLRDLAPVVNGLRAHFPHEPRVPELVEMFTQLRRLGVE